MALDTKLPLRTLRPVRIRELGESALCLSYDNRGIHIYVQRLKDLSIAVFLNGDHAFHAFEVDITHDWKGLVVPTHGLFVDTASAFDAEEEWPVLGAITLGNGGASLGVLMENRQGFSEKLRLNLDLDVLAIVPGLTVGFSRWGFKLSEDEDEACFHVDAAPPNEG